VELAAGDTLLAFTDGVTEAQGADGMFGEERLFAAARAGGSPAAVLDRVDAALAGHARGAEPFDDITLLAAGRLG
jgi:serine phosphatase RsbU (regulator of sigma subunit)